jgi:hypothetical protein
MRIGLIDVDGHNFPNLPLMKISAWHKAQGDHVEWYQPMFSGHMDRVYMSKVFSFTQDYEYYIDADEIIKGGSGYCIRLEDGKEVYDTEKDQPLPREIEHIYPDYSLYPELTKDTAYGYLTRGCPRNCGFCHTTQKDGCRSVKVADLTEFWSGQKNIILLDQNILACKEHLDLLDQLIESGSKVEFNGGLDIRMITKQNVEKLKQIKSKRIHFAFDRYQDRKVVMRNLRIFKEMTGFNRHKGNVTVYVLCNYDTTLEQDMERIQFCRELNFSPYLMIYDKKHADPIYRQLQRWVNNSWVFWKVPTFEEYNSNYKRQ